MPILCIKTQHVVAEGFASYMTNAPPIWHQAWKSQFLAGAQLIPAPIQKLPIFPEIDDDATSLWIPSPLQANSAFGEERFALVGTLEAAIF